MATNDPGDKRHVWGPRPVGGLVAGLTRPAFRRRSPATAQILADWTAIVGPALAAVTVPKRLSGTTLTLACAGPVAMELQHMSGELLARVNGHLGRIAVERVRFVQDAPAAPLPAAPEPPASDVGLPVTGLPDGALRDALVALGRSVRRSGR